MSTTHIFFN